MTKQDYMRLPKERLAELLEEKDRMKDMLLQQIEHPMPYEQQGNIPCFAPNGICTNPHRDCILCPKDWNIGIKTFTTTQQELLKGNNND